MRSIVAKTVIEKTVVINETSIYGWESPETQQKTLTLLKHVQAHKDL